MPKKQTRNAQGAGTIRQRSDGRWEARCTVGRDSGTGKQIQKSIYGATQKEVRQKLQQMCNDLNNGTYLEPSKLTVAGWIDTWLTDYLGNVKPYTLKSYRERANIHIKPALGAIKLTSISAPSIQKFINSLSKATEERKALSPKTIKNIHGVLHKALQQAVIIGYLHFNPADNCTLPRITKKEIKPLEQEDIVRFMKAIEGHKFEYLYLVDLFTGMRQGEILGLTWENVDFESGTILVCQQLQKQPKPDSRYILTSLKNDKSRKIAVARTVMETLRKQKRKQLFDRMAAGVLWKPDIEGLVFTNEFGCHLTHITVWKQFHDIVSSIGLSEARFHDLRHTYAVSSIQAGDDIKTVQENLGHYSASFTLDVYGHVTDRMKQDSADRMERYIKKISG